MLGTVLESFPQCRFNCINAFIRVTGDFHFTAQFLCLGRQSLTDRLQQHVALLVGNVQLGQDRRVIDGLLEAVVTCFVRLNKV